MPRNRTNSLIGGRNRAPLSDDEVRRVTNTFVGLDREANFRYNPEEPTRFFVEDVDGVNVGTVEFGADVYPGRNVIDPNSALSMQAAVAHELAHLHRWKNRTELPHGDLQHLDEALTSLEAALRFQRSLSEHEINQLIRDAVQRITLYVTEIDEDAAADPRARAAE